MRKNFKSMCIAALGASMILGAPACAETVTEVGVDDVATEVSSAVTEEPETDAAIEAETDGEMSTEFIDGLQEDATEAATEKKEDETKATEAATEAAVDSVSSATELGEGGLNFGDVDLSDDLKKELILDYLKGADGNLREMYQIATCVNDVPTIGSVEFVLDPEDMTFMASSEANTKKLNNMLANPQVDMYWTRQIQPGDICSEDLPVTPSYFMSYGVEITGTFQAIDWASLDENDKAVYLEKARTYFETMGAQYKAIVDMEDENLFAFLSASKSTYYVITPSKIVVTSPWFLAPYDTGYARGFVSEDVQKDLLKAVQEEYPDTENLTTLDPQTMTATGLKTQLTLAF